MPLISTYLVIEILQEDHLSMDLAKALGEVHLLADLNMPDNHDWRFYEALRQGPNHVELWYVFKTDEETEDA